MKKIILISGVAGSGKDTTANYMREYLEDKKYSVAILHYASHIKQILKDVYKWNGVKDDWARNKLQWLGTDKIRNELNMPSYHVDRTCEHILFTKDDFDFYIIPDCRFPNEIDVVVESFGKENVITIRVHRENYVSQLTKEQQRHISETALDNYNDFDYITTSDNLDECKKNAVNICNQILDNINYKS